MQTFMILRRNGWGTPPEVEAAGARSSEEGQKMSEDIRWIRTYVFTEPDGSLGCACVYQGTDAEAVRRHAENAGLPATEVLAVADTVIVNPDPEPAAT